MPVRTPLLYGQKMSPAPSERRQRVRDRRNVSPDEALIRTLTRIAENLELVRWWLTVAAVTLVAILGVVIFRAIEGQ